MSDNEEGRVEESGDDETSGSSIARRFRMDVIQEVVEVDREAGTVELLIYPDPRRYEWREDAGERFLYDRFDQTVMGSDLVMQMLRESQNIKPLSQPQQLGDAITYVKGRSEAIRRRLSGQLIDDPPADPASEALARFIGKKHEYVAVVLDIKDSTRLARSVDAAVMARIVEAVSAEMSAVLTSFYGHVLKYTGDGLIAVFAAPNFIRMNDHALDCALTMRRLVYEGLNPAFVEWDYPSIEIRIGIEGGEGIATILGDSSTKRSIDLIGDFISMAAKLEASAPPGGIYLGYITERNLHTAWRQQLLRVSMPATWDYLDDRGNSYPVYEAPVVRT
jgi:class 3 adenylate cyclase